MITGGEGLATRCGGLFRAEAARRVVFAAPLLPRRYDSGTGGLVSHAAPGKRHSRRKGIMTEIVSYIEGLDLPVGADEGSR